MSSSVNATDAPLEALREKPFFLREDSRWRGGEAVDAGEEGVVESVKARMVDVEWLTVAGCRLEVEGLVARCKMQLTAKADMRATGCVFKPLPLEKTESAVEVFANSAATFSSCVFFDGLRTSVVARNYACVVFKDCVFVGNSISVFIMDNAVATFEGCRFVGGGNVEVFVTKGSQVSLRRCVFTGSKGRGVFAKDGSIVVVEDCDFRKMARGAIAAVVGCEVEMMDLRICDVGNTAVLLVERCRAKGERLTVSDVEGNGVNIDNSCGTFRDCVFSRCKFPALATIGRRCNPVFVGCCVRDCDVFMAICKLLSAPTFRRCVFSSCRSHAMSVTTLSHPTVDDCVFRDVEREDVCISAYGGVKVEGGGPYRMKEVGDCLVGDARYKEEEEEEEDVIEVKSWRSPTYVNYGDVERLPIEEEEGSKTLDVGRRLQALRNGDADYVNLPCGHCFREGEGGEDFCAVCSCGIKKTAKVRDFGDCAICLDNPASAVCLPCGHKAMCAMCAVKCVEKSFRCPVCNEGINSITFT